MNTTASANASRPSQTRSFSTVFLIEMWERFGYYGMQALIVYYMVQKLGFPDERATLVWGAAAALIYVAPAIGGCLDRACKCASTTTTPPTSPSTRRSRPRRRPGGGRKRTVATDPTLKKDLERLIEPGTRGDPESPLRWTCKSVRRLAQAGAATVALAAF